MAIRISTVQAASAAFVEQAPEAPPRRQRLLPTSQAGFEQALAAQALELRAHFEKEHQRNVHAVLQRQAAQLRRAFELERRQLMHVLEHAQTQRQAGTNET